MREMDWEGGWVRGVGLEMTLRAYALMHKHGDTRGVGGKLSCNSIAKAACMEQLRPVESRVVSFC